ncbi:hypothetical protein N7532_003302 [Penicillium argentinense]|uniref:Uncharacterized protein n=1 Tax=Penicillium argentinense TaxID=1131581 RepID=A0A9W9FM81_9EURO|nr:uncharacterized protein N7532_003302 [Penicillium argentinense]KAJ5102773.1 hypothetical protein N7532_003302 [Penicillium argentinense]
MEGYVIPAQFVPALSSRSGIFLNQGLTIAEHSNKSRPPPSFLPSPPLHHSIHTLPSTPRTQSGLDS